MENFTALEKVMYEKAIQKKSPLFSIVVKGVCFVALGFGVYFLYLAVKYDDSRILNKATISLLSSFFLWALFTYQNIIRKLHQK